MPHSMCGSGSRWCARADAIFAVPDMHILDVQLDERQRLVLTVESGHVEHGCPLCGVLAVGHGRRVRMLHDEQLSLVALAVVRHRRTWGFGQLPRQDAYARTRGRFRRLTGGRCRSSRLSTTYR